MTIRAHDLAAFAGAVDPQSINNNSLSSDWVDISRFRSALIVLMVGVTDTTVDFKLQEAKDSSGTGAQDLTGRSITQFTGSDDNKQAAVAVSEEQLTRNSGYRYVRGVATVGSGATGALVAVAAIGLCPRFGPAFDQRHADCAQVIG